MIRVLVVDDQNLFAAGVKRILEQYDMQVTTCHFGIMALEILKKQSFDVLLYDLKMPGMDGLELTKRTLALYPDATIIILSGYDIADYYNELIDAGAIGFANKTNSDQRLVTCIQMALDKMTVLPHALVKKLRLTYSQSVQDNNQLEPPLTTVELEIAKQLVAGKVNKEIADVLNMSVSNVEYHLSKIYRKLTVSCRSQAIGKLINMNIIPMVS